MPKYGEPIWSLVLKAANNVSPPFSAADIIREVHKNKPEIPSATLGTYVRAMAPNHPSSSHYPSTRANHGYFTHLGEGRFRLKSDILPTPVPVLLTPSPPPFNEKETFLAKNREAILRWLDAYKERIIKARGEYAWADNAPLEALEKRREISRRIVLSRIRNGGGVDIETINAVMDWGGLRPFPKEPSEALCLTKKAFDLLDSGDLKGATLVLLGVSNFGIASASKVLGLFDGDHYCIYDSRVGTALKTLRNNGEKLILAPSGRGRRGDNCPKDKWAVYYERLIWVMEVIRDQLNLEGHPFSIADIEMALFMIGK